MSKLTIVAFDGTRHELDVANGSTVMENAVRNSVPGIEAECGGACACATWTCCRPCTRWEACTRPRRAWA